MPAQEIRTTHVKVTTVDLEIAVTWQHQLVRVLTQPLWCCRKFWSQRPHPGSHGTIAKEGYVAIAPALFCPGFETGYTPEDIEIGKITSNKPRHQSYWAIFKQRLTTSKPTPSETRCLWLYRLCFGGHVAYLAATLPDIKLRLRSTVLALPPRRRRFFHNYTHTRNQRHPLRLLWHGRRQHPT